MQYIHASSGFTCSKWQVIISICNMLLNVQFFVRTIYRTWLNLAHNYFAVSKNQLTLGYGKTWTTS